MLLLKIFALLTVLAIAAGIIFWLWTGQRGYLLLSLRIAKLALVLVLLFFALLTVEQLNLI